MPALAPSYGFDTMPLAPVARACTGIRCGTLEQTTVTAGEAKLHGHGRRMSAWLFAAADEARHVDRSSVPHAVVVAVVGTRHHGQ
eukprot:360629-Chlamydomonas_euryale.AAC.3